MKIQNDKGCFGSGHIFIVNHLKNFLNEVTKLFSKDSFLYVTLKFGCHHSHRFRLGCHQLHLWLDYQRRSIWQFEPAPVQTRNGLGNHFHQCPPS